MMKVASLRRTRYHARISRFHCERSRFSVSPGRPAPHAHGPERQGPKAQDGRPAGPLKPQQRDRAWRVGQGGPPGGRRVDERAASTSDSTAAAPSADRGPCPGIPAAREDPHGPTEAGHPQAPTNPAIRWPAEQHHAAATASGRAAAFPCQGAKQEGEHEPQLPGGARRGALPGAGDTPARANPSCLCPPRCPWPRRAACR